MGLLGDGLVAASGAQYNGVRLVAGLVGLAGSAVLLFYGDRQKRNDLLAEIDNQDRPTSRLRRMLDFRHYPVETGFMLGTIEATLLIPAGAGAFLLEKAGKARPIEVASAVTDLGALLIGNLVKQISPDTPRPPPVWETRDGNLDIHIGQIVPHMKDYVQRNPMKVSEVLFQVGAVSYMISGFAAGDHTAAAAGTLYTVGNLALNWASKRGQGATPSVL